MKCEMCGHDHSGVTDSRPFVGGIRRRRQCERCGHRWTTKEYPADITSMVGDPYLRKLGITAMIQGYLRLSKYRRRVARDVVAALVLKQRIDERRAADAVKAPAA